MSMMSKVKNLLSGKKLYALDDTNANVGLTSKEMPAETEVNFIKSLLEKKFNRKFQLRVKVEGYLGEKDMKYMLVMDDFCNHNVSLRDYHSIYGNNTNNVLDVQRAFLEAYWRNVQKSIDGANDTSLSDWDRRMVEDYQKTTVAKSHEELMIMAELEGII